MENGLVDDEETDWVYDRSDPELKFEPEVEQLHEQE